MRKIINHLSSAQVTARSPRRLTTPTDPPRRRFHGSVHCIDQRSCPPHVGRRGRFDRFAVRSPTCPRRTARFAAALNVLIRRSHVKRPGLRYRPGPFCFCRRTLSPALEENFMKITINTRKPRNPLVAPAHFRRAARHQPRGGSMRQQAGRSLRRELDQFKQHSP